MSKKTKKATKRKVSKVENRNKEKNLTWDSLEEERQKLLGMVIEQQTFIHNLVNSELTEEDIKNEPEFVKTLDGLNQTYMDLMQRTIDISKEHGDVIEERVIEDTVIPIVETQKGKLDSDNIDEFMKYQSILNKYAEVGFSISSVSTGPMSEVVFGVASIKGKKEKVSQEEVDDVMKDLKSDVDKFKASMEAFNINTIHNIVPTKESVKEEYEKALDTTKDMIKEELEDINSKKGDTDGRDEQ